jgi:hypothetical protein
LFFTGLAVIISPSAFLSSVDGKYILNSDDYILNNGGDRFADGLKFPHSIVLGKFLSRGLRYCPSFSPPGGAAAEAVVFPKFCGRERRHSTARVIGPPLSKCQLRRNNRGIQ